MEGERASEGSCSSVRGSRLCVGDQVVKSGGRPKEEDSAQGLGRKGDGGHGTGGKWSGRVWLGHGHGVG